MLHDTSGLTQSFHPLGYLIVYYPEHPNAWSGMVYLHRLIMENKIGRYLENNEHVHHIDEDKTNNNEDNLIILSNNEHQKLHHAALEQINCKICGIEFKPQKSKQKYCGKKCQLKDGMQIDWPSTTYILNELESKTYIELSKELGVSDNAIRKFLIRNNVIPPRRKRISDNELITMAHSRYNRL